MRKPDLPIFEIEQPLLETLTRQKGWFSPRPPARANQPKCHKCCLTAVCWATGQVTVLQPRRLPTRMLAAWVAQARDVKLGGEVGYQMRLDNVTSAATRICYVTEGVLLRRMLADPDLKGVSAIVFDEFHERHLYGDITLARALQIQESTRPDLIIIVMSATLDVPRLRSICSLARCCRRRAARILWPSNICPNLPVTAPVWELAVKELQRLVRQHSQGDALIFMPGAYEITRTVQAARDTLGPQFIVLSIAWRIATQRSGCSGGPL